MCNIVDDGGIKVHEYELALSVVAQQRVIAVDVAVNLAQVAQLLHILNREEEGIHVL